MPALRRALGLWIRGRGRARIRPDTCLRARREDRLPLLPGLRMHGVLARAYTRRVGPTPHRGQPAPGRTCRGGACSDRPPRRAARLRPPPPRWSPRGRLLVLRAARTPGAVRERAVFVDA